MAKGLPRSVADNQTVNSLVAQVGELENAVTVRAFGAQGDGVTDDSDAIQEAVNVADGRRPVEFSPGVYLVGDGLSTAGAAVTVAIDNTTLVLAPGAVIKFVGTAVSSTAIRVSANGFRLIGGEIRGTWDMVGQGTGAIVSTDGDGSLMLSIRAQDETLSGFHVFGTRFTLASGRAFLAAQNSPQTKTYGDVLFRGVRFDNNFSAFHFNNLALEVPAKSLTFDDVTIDGTASPGQDVEGATMGGNAMFFDGTFDDVDFDRLRVRNCGRMAIEMFMPSVGVAAGFLSKNVRIRNSRIETTRYRTLSVLALNVSIDNNLLDGGPLLSSWMELAGQDISLTRNHIIGQGWDSSEVPQGAITKRGYVVRDNRFTDVPAQGATGAVAFKNQVQCTVEGNNADYANAQSTVDGVQSRAVFNIESSMDVTCRRNHTNFAAPCDRGGGYDVATIRDGTFQDNTVDFTGIQDDVVFTPFKFVRLQDCLLQRNKARTDRPFRCLSPSLLGDPMQGGAIHRYVWDGLQQVFTPAHTELLNDPPITPVVGVPHAVGNAPTGAWAGQPGTFATWNGASWAFEPIIDALMYQPSAPAWDTLHMPRETTKVGSYLTVEGGWVRVSTLDNDFSQGDGILSRDGTGIEFLPVGVGDGPLVNAALDGNRDTVTVDAALKFIFLSGLP